MDHQHAPVQVGQRIRLTQMGKDPNPIEPGAQGEVTMVTDCTSFDGTWQIGVRWDNGRTLSLIAPTDKFEVLGPFPSTVIARPVPPAAQLIQTGASFRGVSSKAAVRPKPRHG